MEVSAYHLFMAGMALIIQTAGAVAWMSRIKNEIHTRVAVLEAGHDALNDDLKEIKQDVKELLRAVTS